MARGVVPISAAAVALTLVLLAGGAGGSFVTSYPQTGRPAYLLTVLAAAGLVAAAAGAWLYGRPSTGIALSLAAVGWVAPLWTGWVSGPTVARTAGMIVAPLLVPALLQLTPAPRAVVRGFWLLAAGTSLAVAALRDPYLDPYCWSNCTVNGALVRALPGPAQALGRAWLVLVVAAAVLAAVTAARSRRGAAAAAALALAAEAAYAVALLVRPASSTRTPSART